MAEPTAPTTAQQAAERQHELRQAGDQLVVSYETVSKAQALAEWLYRKAEAMGEPQVRHGKDGEARKRMLLGLGLDDYFIGWADRIGAMAELEPPEGAYETVGDLRWLRDTAQAVARGAHKRAAYHESEMKYATTVVAWARREYEQTMGGAA